MVRFSTRFVCSILLLSGLLASCQKDESVKTTVAEEKADSSLSAVANPGNYLAIKGNLKIRVQDSTYTFDAAQDSIAFVNMDIEGEQYFGVTAINKAHTISFGISSVGSPIAEVKNNIAGAQFLMSAPGKNNIEYTLTPHNHQKDYGTIVLSKYNQDTVLAKGTFHTYLANSNKKNTTLYIADGSFELQTK